MGCGSSSSAAASKPGARDPEDFHLEVLVFKKMDLAKLDDWLEQVAEPVNTVIEISNDINECIDDVKGAVADVVGALRIELVTSGAVSQDAVYASLSKADGSAPSKDELKALFDKDAVKAADKSLSAATTKLADLKPKDLAMEGDIITGTGADAFNKSLGDLRTALGDGYKVSVCVSKSDAAGAASVTARVMKPEWAKGAHSCVMRPATIGEVLVTGASKSIAAAQKSVGNATGALAKAVQEAEVKGVTVAWTTKKKKLMVKMSGGEEGEEVAELKTAVKKALSAANSEIFKLFKACTNAQGDVNLARAIVVLVESLIDQITKLATDTKLAVDAIKKAITPKVNISFNEGEFAFEFDLEINLPNLEGKSWKDLLSPQAKLIYDEIMKVKDKLVESFPKFTELKEQVEMVVAEKPSMDEVKAALDEKCAGDVMEITKAMGKVSGNVTAAANSAKTIKVFIDTGSRVYTELSTGIIDIKALLTA